MAQLSLNQIPNKCSGNFCLPVLGLGTYGMGGWIERDLKNDGINDMRAIQYAFSKGITHFDTAEIYAQGMSEIILTFGRSVGAYFSLSKSTDNVTS